MARHSGPSLDKCYNRISLEEVQKRGRWRSTDSVRRHEKKANAAGDVDLSVKSNAAVLPASRLTAGKRSRQTNASQRQYISPQSKVGCFFIGLSSGEQEFGRALRRLGCKVYRFDVLQGKKGDVLWLPSFSKTFPSPYLQWVLLGSTSRTSMWIFHTSIGNCSLCPKERTVSRGHS